MKPTTRSKPNISAVPKQVGGVLIRDRKAKFLDLGIEQKTIDAREQGLVQGKTSEGTPLVKSRAGRLGSEINISPYDPANEYWVTRAYQFYGLPGWGEK